MGFPPADWLISVCCWKRHHFRISTVVILKYRVGEKKGKTTKQTNKNLNANLRVQGTLTWISFAHIYSKRKYMQYALTGHVQVFERLLLYCRCIRNCPTESSNFYVMHSKIRRNFQCDRDEQENRKEATHSTPSNVTQPQVIDRFRKREQGWNSFVTFQFQIQFSRINIQF